MVSLTDTELAALTQRQAQAEKAAAALATSQEQRVKLAEELARLRKEQAATQGAVSTTLQTQLEEQQRLLNSQGDQIGRQHAEWVEAQKQAAAAAAALASARAQQTRAAEDIDLVWHKTIKDVAARHLRAVEEMETAARVVSQGVQSGPTKAAKP